MLLENLFDLFTHYGHLIKTNEIEFFDIPRESVGNVMAWEHCIRRTLVRLKGSDMELPLKKYHMCLYDEMETVKQLSQQQALPEDDGVYSDFKLTTPSSTAVLYRRQMHLNIAGHGVYNKILSFIYGTNKLVNVLDQSAQVSHQLTNRLSEQFGGLILAYKFTDPKNCAIFHYRDWDTAEVEFFAKRGSLEWNDYLLDRQGEGKVTAYTNPFLTYNANRSISQGIDLAIHTDSRDGLQPQGYSRRVDYDPITIYDGNGLENCREIAVKGDLTNALQLDSIKIDVTHPFFVENDIKNFRDLLTNQRFLTLQNKPNAATGPCIINPSLNETNLSSFLEAYGNLTEAPGEDFLKVVSDHHLIRSQVSAPPAGFARLFQPDSGAENQESFCCIM